MSKRRNEQLERLRSAFWSAEDAAPAQVADTYEARAAYEQESLSLQILDGVQKYMERNGITQQALAASLGLTEGRVSQILSGEQNLTLKTLAAVAAGLKAHFDIKLLPAVGGSWERPPLQDVGPDSATPTTPAPAPATAESRESHLVGH